MDDEIFYFFFSNDKGNKLMFANLRDKLEIIILSGIY